MKHPVQLSPREQKLLEAAMAEAADQITDTLLDTCADNEYRICLLELGIAE